VLPIGCISAPLPILKMHPTSTIASTESPSPGEEDVPIAGLLRVSHQVQEVSLSY
jgi:hypothetical protein